MYLRRRRRHHRDRNRRSRIRSQRNCPIRHHRHRRGLWLCTIWKSPDRSTPRIHRQARRLPSPPSHTCCGDCQNRYRSNRKNQNRTGSGFWGQPTFCCPCPCPCPCYRCSSFCASAGCCSCPISSWQKTRSDALPPRPCCSSRMTAPAPALAAAAAAAFAFAFAAAERRQTLFSLSFSGCCPKPSWWTPPCRCRCRCWFCCSSWLPTKTTTKPWPWIAAIWGWRFWNWPWTLSSSFWTAPCSVDARRPGRWSTTSVTATAMSCVAFPHRYCCRRP
mmetsp:Transcript_16834/g.46189  ORF Transcript_16834/g.46189 Transcript_16834/m.46189 type:complete len:275 (+) Transcript_16834:2528-3352(+)